MAATRSSSSSIGQAFAGKSALIPIGAHQRCDTRHRTNQDTFATVAARPSSHHGMLPTPPNSISPNLPAHGFKHNDQARASPPHQPDSDIDLQDAVEHAKIQYGPQHVLNAEALDRLGDLDSAGAITSTMLAQHHLPELLLAHGPLAIRHIMGHLTTSVPGFARITNAKARRLVVAALEGRGNGTDHGAPRQDVEFEKVGWGRWDAVRQGQAPRDRARIDLSPVSTRGALPIPGQRSAPEGSWGGLASSHADSAFFSHSEDVDYGENEDVIMHEADKMSLSDVDAGYASSTFPPDDAALDDIASDATDEEDWAGIGAKALRARSLPQTTHPPPRHLYEPVPIPRSPRSSIPRPSVRSRSRGSRPSMPPIPLPALSATHDPSSAPQPVLGGAQERDAVEALLSLGSV